MTRESKLALMIAVTLILLVGVLLSDHLSGATEAQFEDAPVARKAATPVAVLPGAETRAADPIAALPAQAEPAGLAADEPLGDPEADPFSFAPEPVVIAQGPVQRDGLIESALTGVDSAIQRVRASDPPVLMDLFKPVTDESVTLPPRDPHQDSPVKPVGEPGTPATPANPGWSTAEPVAVPSWKTHTVVAGDNLYRLAARYLGDGDRWPELQAMNSDLLKGSETVQVGMVLKVGRGAAPASASAPAKPAGKPAAAASGAHREYVVLKGDMLSTISQKLLGTVRRMDEIVKLNGLKDPDDIRVGQTLKIPAR